MQGDSEKSCGEIVTYVIDLYKEGPNETDKYTVVVARRGLQ